jgi:hypothetical protein
VPVAPAAARVVVVSTRVSHHGRTGTPGIPARDGFNSLFRALPGDRALLPPSPRRHYCDTWRQRRGVRTTRLRRPQDSALVFGATRVHRIPHPTFVTIAKRPFVWAGMARDMQVIWVRGQEKFGKSEINHL